MSRGGFVAGIFVLSSTFLVLGACVACQKDMPTAKAEVESDNPEIFPENPFNPQSGITLRDYFAATAPPWYYGGGGSTTWWKRDPQEEAKWRYEYADAMLKERAK
jgi:hypothetical protein